MESPEVFAKQYLENILSFFGLNIEVGITSVQVDIIELSIPSSDLNGFLIGQRGDTLRALQSLVAGALKNKGYAVFRVSLDVADYKKQRASRIQEQAAVWVEQVKESGEPLQLKPMNASDRRTVHQFAADSGVVSESAGEGHDRHIILKPKD